VFYYNTLLKQWVNLSLDSNIAIIETEPNAEDYPDGTVIVQYVPTEGGKVFGKTAFEYAQDGGFQGSEEDLSDVLASMNNMNDLFTELFSEDIGGGV
jgi:hypothetical protein